MLTRQPVKLSYNSLLGFPDVRSVPEPAAEDDYPRISLAGKIDVGVAEEFFLSYKL
jgi:hypothetical protein